MKLALIALIPATLMSADAFAQVTSAVDTAAGTINQGVDPALQQTLDAQGRINTSRFNAPTSRIEMARQRRAERAARRAAAQVSAPEPALPAAAEIADVRAVSDPAPTAMPEAPALEADINAVPEAVSELAMDPIVEAADITPVEAGIAEVTADLQAAADTVDMNAVTQAPSVPAPQLRAAVVETRGDSHSVARHDMRVREERYTRSEPGEGRAEAEQQAAASSTAMQSPVTRTPASSQVPETPRAGGILPLVLAGLLITLLLAAARKLGGRRREV